MHFKPRLACVLSMLLALLMTQSAVAQEPPKKVIEQTVTEALEVLRNQALKSDSKQRLQKLREVADKTFDWSAMAQSSLGAPWRQLNEGQRKEFVDVFKELLAQRYMNDLDRFQGSEQLTVGNAEQQADMATVKTTLLTASREQIPIDYTLRQSGGKWRAQDVSIEGVSLVNHYRKTFSRFLINKSFVDLMQQLKHKLGPGASAPAPS